MFKEKFSLFLFLALEVLFIACERPYDSYLIEAIEIGCQNIEQGDTCIFDLNILTPFTWEKVYFVAGPTTEDELNQIVGFNCNCGYVKDQYTKVLYSEGDKIVYQSVYYNRGSQLQLRPYTMKNYSDLHYSSDSSKFYVLKKGGALLTKDSIYDLFPVKGQRKPN